MKYISSRYIEFHGFGIGVCVWLYRGVGIIGLVLLSFTLASTSYSDNSKKNISVKEVKQKHASKGLRGYYKKITTDAAGSYDLCDNDSFTLINGPSDDIEEERASLGIDCTKKRSTGRYTHISSVTGNSYLSDTMNIPTELVGDDFNASTDSLHNTMDLGYFGRFFDDMRVQNASKIIAIKQSLNVSDSNLLGLAINNTGLFARDVEVEYQGETYIVPYTIQPGEIFPFKIPVNQNKINSGQLKTQASFSSELELGRAMEISGYGLKGVAYKAASSLSPEDQLLLGENVNLLPVGETVVVFAPVLGIRLDKIIANGAFVQPPIQIDDITVVVAFFDQTGKMVHLEQPDLFLSSYNGDDHNYLLSNSLLFNKLSRFAFTNPNSFGEWADYGIWVGGKE